MLFIKEEMEVNLLKRTGYVPEKGNLISAKPMDAGKMLTARISRIEKKGTFTRISIGVYLVDF